MVAVLTGFHSTLVSTLCNPIILYTHPIILLYYYIIYFKYDRTTDHNPMIKQLTNPNPNPKPNPNRNTKPNPQNIFYDTI